MIYSNLNVLLAERNLKITKLSLETGISRTTITSLCNNTGAGVQFDTLNKICGHLHVMPKDILCYFPYNYTLTLSQMTHEDNEHILFDCIFTLEKNGKLQTIHVDADIAKDEDDVTITMCLPEEDDEQIAMQNTCFRRFYNALPPIVKNKIAEDITQEIFDQTGSPKNIALLWDI